MQTNKCSCPLGADECTGDSGVFYPLGNGGSCAVRPCQKPYNPEWEMSWAGASLAKSIKMAEEEYELWKPR
jgi:hypothetical protein